MCVRACVCTYIRKKWELYKMCCILNTIALTHFKAYLNLTLFIFYVLFLYFSDIKYRIQTANSEIDVYNSSACNVISLQERILRYTIANFYKQKMNVPFVQLKLYKQCFFSIQEKFC